MLRDGDSTKRKDEMLITRWSNEDVVYNERFSIRLHALSKALDRLQITLLGHYAEDQMLCQSCRIYLYKSAQRKQNGQIIQLIYSANTVYDILSIFPHSYF